MSGDLALYSRIMFIFDGLHKAWGQKTLTRHGVERILFPHWTNCDKKLVVVVNYCTYTKPINGWFKLSWQLVCLWYEHTNKIESTLWLRTDFIILAAYRRLASIFVVIWIQQTQSVNLNLDQFYVWVLFLHIDRKKMKYSYRFNAQNLSRKIFQFVSLITFIFHWASSIAATVQMYILFSHAITKYAEHRYNWESKRSMTVIPYSLSLSISHQNESSRPCCA